MEISRVTNAAVYNELYNYSICNTTEFWDDLAKSKLDWFEPYSEVYRGNIETFSDLKSNDYSTSWFVGGKINACYNALDRFLGNPKTADKIAYYWQGDHESDTAKITYRLLHMQVCKFSNVLKKLGINKGDRVCIYLPICIEAITAMLACARVGAVHTVVFAGFSPEALAERIMDAECKLLITTDISKRGGKTIPLWDNANEAINIINQYSSKSTAKSAAEKSTSGQASGSAHVTLVQDDRGKPNLQSVLLIEDYYSNIKQIPVIIENFTNQNTNINIFDYKDLENRVNDYCEPEWMCSEDPLFILYTSGSTGKPKGVLHTTAGYLLHTSYSFKLVLDVRDSDVYWCSADIGWVAGHSYVVYGALLNNTTSVIFSGTPNYPKPDIFWQIVDKYKVSIFYTAPTAIRALMQAGNQYLESSTRDSLRVLATVGEPINPEAWQWYYEKVGHAKCPIVDTWWQTETGAAMLSPYSNLNIQKPGCVALPFMGIQLALLDDNKQQIADNMPGQGHLVVKAPWPGMMRTVYNNHNKYIDTYFKPFQNYFYTGDLAKRDSDGHYWILGRSDDVINIAGHRLGTAEIESALASHDSVCEAAVVAIPDDIKGQALYSYVVLHNHEDREVDVLEKALKEHVKHKIGPIAIIKTIRIVSGLPKTRSGKIMRRILKQIAVKSNDFGDISTLTNPEVIQELI